MNTKPLKIVTTAIKVISIIGYASAYADFIPAKFAPIGILVFGLASTAKDLFVKAGDLLDDGKANDSFHG